MPIYEYQCKSCGHGFEVLQGINESPELSCEKCDGGKIERVLSAGAFVFKGSGFYATDYKNKDKGKAEDKGKTEDKGKVEPKTKEQAPSCGPCAQSGGCPAAGSDA